MARKFFIRRNPDTDPVTYDVLRRRRGIFHDAYARGQQRVQAMPPTTITDALSRAAARELARRLNEGEVDPEPILREYERKIMPR